MSVWDTVVGQKPVVERLKREVARPDELAQSWLIAGPPGSGRSNLALAFAAALECPNGGDGTCKSCRDILSGTSPDVTVLSTQAVTITIDSVRRIVADSEQMPSVSPWRIIIIEDVDRMAERTTNVLLKEVEEPAPHTIWILCAPGAQDVLPTIRSRCRLVTLAVPSDGEVAAFLLKQYGPDGPGTAAVINRLESKQGTGRGPERGPGRTARRGAKGTKGAKAAKAGPGAKPSPQPGAKAALKDLGLPITPDIARQDARIAQGHIGIASLYARNRQMVRDRGEVIQGILALRRSSDAVVLAGRLVSAAQRQAEEAVTARHERLVADFRRDNGLAPTDAIPPRLRGDYLTAAGKAADLKREATRKERDVYDRTLNDISSIYRDISVLRVHAEESAGIVNLENRSAIQDLAVRLTERQTIERLEAIETARRRIAGNGLARLDFEALLCALVPPFRPGR